MQAFKSKESCQEGRHRDGRILSLVEIPIGDLKKVRRRKFSPWGRFEWRTNDFRNNNNNDKSKTDKK